MPDRIDMYFDDSSYPEVWPYAPSYSILNPWPDPCTYYPNNKNISFNPVNALGSSQVTLPTADPCTNSKIIARFCANFTGGGPYDTAFLEGIAAQTIYTSAILKTKVDTPMSNSNAMVYINCWHWIYYGFDPTFGHQVAIYTYGPLSGIIATFTPTFNGYYPPYTWYHGIYGFPYVGGFSIPRTNSLGYELVRHVFCIDLYASFIVNDSSNTFTIYYGGTDESEGYDNIYPASRISWFVPVESNPLPPRIDGKWIGY